MVYYYRPPGMGLIFFAGAMFCSNGWNIWQHCVSQHSTGLCLAAMIAQTLYAGIGAWGFTEGLAWNNWAKRDTGDLLHLYETGYNHLSGDTTASPVPMRDRNEDIRLKFHRRDGTAADGWYSFDNETQSHSVFTSFGDSFNQDVVPTLDRRSASVMANPSQADAATGFAMHFTSYHPDSGKMKVWLKDNVQHVAMETAQRMIAMKQGKEPFADSICLGYYKEEKGKKVQVAGILLEPANEQNYKKVTNTCAIPRAELEKAGPVQEAPAGGKRKRPQGSDKDGKRQKPSN